MPNVRRTPIVATEKPVAKRTKGTAIKRWTDGYWEWFVKNQNPPDMITGKYLFFSTDRHVLVRIAMDELTTGGFHEAKIPMKGSNLSPEYVLCLYYSDDSRKRELAGKYRNRPDLKYRYWKSDDATLKGQYSKEFLVGLPPDMQKIFIDSLP